MKQLPRACSFVLLPGCGPDTRHQARAGAPCPSDTPGNNLHLEPGLFLLNNSSTDTNKAAFFLICMLVTNEKLKNSSTTETFLCINRNVLGIVFNPQIYKEVETAFNSQNDVPNFPALVPITKVNPAEVCSCNNTEFGLLFHI